MNVQPTARIQPTAAAALNASTARRNAVRFPAGARVLDWSTGAHGRVTASSADSPIHTVRLDNGMTVSRYAASLVMISDRPRGNGRLAGGVEVWA